MHYLERASREIESRKQSSDANWDKIYSLYKEGKVGKDLLISAMEQSNNADKAWLNIQRKMK